MPYGKKCNRIRLQGIQLTFDLCFFSLSLSFPKKIPIKITMKRWANEHLRTVNKHIADITTDFSDGIRLIALVEVLSGKRLPNYNKRPKVRAQKIENVNIALQFLKNDEKIRIVNIGIVF